MQISEQRQFLVVQRVIAIGQCVTDRFGRHPTTSCRERGKGEPR